MKIDDYDILYSEKDKTIGFKNRGSMPDFDFFKSKGLKFNQIARISPYLEKEGCYTLNKNDITVDIKGEPHIKGDAFDVKTLDEIENLLQDEKQDYVKAIVFERVSEFPLNENILNKIKTELMYNLNPYKNNKELKEYNYYGQSGNRAYLKHLYNRNKNFYPKLKKSKVNFNNLKLLKSETDKEISDKKVILKRYFKILAPGGLFIFMSASSFINRHGGIVFQDDEENLFSPFKNLDDIHLQKLFRSILKDIGFERISFFKDPYFKEDVLYIKAFKPKKVNT